MTAPLVEARALRKVYGMVAARVEALRGLDLDVAPGEFVGIVGPSGCGKSTLLHVLGCLDRPTGGTYRFRGREVARLSDAELSRTRATSIGFVFQRFNLIPEYDVVQNVALPFFYWDRPVPDATHRAEQALERVGLAHRKRHRPAELSGGELQRAAIARALVARPELLLADEPTGNLDTETSARILDLFGTLHADGATLIVATHDAHVAARCDRIVALRDGRIEREGPDA